MTIRLSDLWRWRAGREGSSHRAQRLEGPWNVAYPVPFVLYFLLGMRIGTGGRYPTVVGLGSS